MMVVAPDTVRREKLPEAHGPPTPRAAGGHRALPLVPRHHAVRASSATPGAPSPQKGETLMAACRDGIAAVLRDPATWS